jgi:16S rRNA (adenine(1408)-N(1))-methyltransferase
VQVAIDIGTGDGRAVLEAARRDPDRLVVGVDANAASMAEASRRAAMTLRRGGLPNALFVVAGAATMPAELASVASSATVTFPWGSLLRGCLGRDADVARGIGSVLRPGGRLGLVLAPAARDHLDDLPTTPDAVMAAARATFEELGLVFVSAGVVTPDALAASGSTWARRLLRDGRERRATRIIFESP